ncbi:DMT family transporter [Arenicella xantha]|uniref:Threonine/homoserine efflux transporter RhtA n=1 Tax=Arenicella xantha TaxID=644221 RepID=A0A395JL52_9GAMM|nr:DMT family transporter [Arenicella xantha]RBP49698.1 threonine/homoserine efflux transporter RhtA [Arenicella xantha]
MKTGFLSLIALLAFAGNSVLCRLALLQGAIDPTGFTVIRLLSGMVVLMLILAINRGQAAESSASTGSWLAALSLFVYAAGFSFAYQSLDTATGALILFGVVQIAMVGSSVLSGHRPSSIQWLGLTIAIVGLLYLLLPDSNRPSLFGASLMAVAGVAWAVYSLLGQGSVNPVRTTAYNFLKALPFALLLLLLTWDTLQLSSNGVWLAIASGALTSGLGYAVWYAALRSLSTLNAAVVQLSVPIIAALGGLMFSHESISLRLAVATCLVLMGILLVMFPRMRRV